MKRCRSGDTRAFLTVATVVSPRSIRIESRIESFFSWIFSSSSPDWFSITNVLRIRSALPLTL